MFVKIYNQNGEATGQTKLPDEIFNVKVNPNLLHQVVVSQASNRRRAIAHTKDRSEVRGGGKKPWRQKGTGRARHGSIRSPLWAGGGVTFGPTNERNFKKRIPGKMKKKALSMALSAKAQNGLLVVVDSLPAFKEPKTKIIADFLGKLPSKNESALLAFRQTDRNAVLSAKNLEKIQTTQIKDINSLDLLSFKYLIIPKESIKIFKEMFLRA